MKGAARAAVAAALFAACRPSTPAVAPVARPAASASDSAARVAAFGATDGPDALLMAPPGQPTPLRPLVRPRFPALLEQSFATVTLMFVVDSTGHPEPATSAVLVSNAPGFVRAACEALPRMAFAPYVVDGRPRRALVMSTYTAHRSTDETPEPNLHLLDSLVRARPIADVVRYLAAKPGCR
jgi:hypothetical protein